MTFTHALSTNNYGPYKFIVATSAANGTHTTLASAMAAASSGDTILVRDSVTENVTITPGVNIVGNVGSTLNLPTITGTLTMTGAGTSTISGLILKTNSAALLAVTGSAASIVYLENCYLNCSNNDGITFSSSSASALINIRNCEGDLGTTGIKLFAHSSAGSLQFFSSRFTNNGGSSTASTASAGALFLSQCSIAFPITTSGTAALGITNSSAGTSTQNVTFLTCGGSGAHNVLNTYIASGSASAISISGAAAVHDCIIYSTNTNAITGAGSISYSGITFGDTATTINTTTQTISGTLQGSKNTAPTAGMLGEILSASATSVATGNGAATTITSKEFTPGVWEIYGYAGAVATGGTAVMTATQMSISETDNVLGGTFGVDRTQYGSAAGFSNFSAPIGPIRKTISANTTYYIVVVNAYTSTTCPTNASIKGVRVG